MEQITYSPTAGTRKVFGGIYYYVKVNGNISVEHTHDYRVVADDLRLLQGNYFDSPEDAECAAMRVRKAIVNATPSRYGYQYSPGSWLESEGVSALTEHIAQEFDIFYTKGVKDRMCAILSEFFNRMFNVKK